jgi:hypothetical protein
MGRPADELHRARVVVQPPYSETKALGVPPVPGANSFARDVSAATIRFIGEMLECLEAFQAEYTPKAPRPDLQPPGESDCHPPDGER